ncbi:MAG: tRNA (adenosine(37)-N6)-threonylcarbamoyltransferase complex ATPase subunit type 1 TsaE [Chthoniobacterales bacterium]
MPPSKIYYSSSTEETYAVAYKLLRHLGDQAIISLEGPLGAGKTHFVKGFAIALGLDDEVTSPTFTLLQSYGQEDHPLHHFDFYRVNTEAEAMDLGLQDFFLEGFCIIEWGDKFLNLLPSETWRVRIKPVSEHKREISCWQVTTNN